MKIYKILVSTFILCGCASTASHSEVKVPYESVTSQAPALAKDVLDNIDFYLQQNYKCENWQIVNVKHISSEGQMTFTKEGQIYAGIINEIWNLNQCGSPVNLALVMMSDGKGGSYIAIAKL